MKFVGRMGKRKYILSAITQMEVQYNGCSVDTCEVVEASYPDRLIMWNICEYLPPNLHIHTCIPYEQKRGDGTHQQS